MLHRLHRESVPSSRPWLNFCDKRGSVLGYTWLWFNGIWGHLRAYPQEERWSLVLSQLHSSTARGAVGKQRTSKNPDKSPWLWHTSVIIQIHLNPSISTPHSACSWHLPAGESIIIHPGANKWTKRFEKSSRAGPCGHSGRFPFCGFFVGHFCFAEFGLFSLVYRPSWTENSTKWFWIVQKSRRYLQKGENSKL